MTPDLRPFFFFGNKHLIGKVRIYFFLHKETSHPGHFHCHHYQQYNDPLIVNMTRCSALIALLEGWVGVNIQMKNIIGVDQPGYGASSMK